MRTEFAERIPMWNQNMSHREIPVAPKIAVDGEMPNHSAQTDIQSAISEPPHYKEGNYELFRKELLWRLCVHTGISDARAMRTFGDQK